jgi:nicotinate-nucleotide adenylyltransferase
LVLAHEAADQLGLERVVLVPTGEPPHRRIELDPGAEVRLEMARLAAAGDGLLEVSDVEVARPGPSYTARTLELLSEWRAGEELTFLMGADVAAALESWHEPKRVLELARIGVAARPGTVLDEAEEALQRLGGEERMELIRMPEIGVSSTDIRRRAARGGSLRYLVPNPVIELIDERGLYAEGAA